MDRGAWWTTVHGRYFGMVGNFLENLGAMSGDTFKKNLGFLLWNNQEVCGSHCIVTQSIQLWRNSKEERNPHWSHDSSQPAVIAFCLNSAKFFP